MRVFIYGFVLLLGAWADADCAHQRPQGLQAMAQGVLNPAQRALCEQTTNKCGDIRRQFPSALQKAFVSCETPPTNTTAIALHCGKGVGSFIVGYGIGKASMAISTVVTPYLSPVTGPLITAAQGALWVGGGVALAAGSAYLIVSGFQEEARCFQDHDRKRSILEPVSDLMSPELSAQWVRNLSCSQLSEYVSAKIRSADETIAQKRRKLAEREQFLARRPEHPELAERFYPDHLWRLTPAEAAYAARAERQVRAASLASKVIDTMSCLNPEFIAEKGCDMIASVTTGAAVGFATSAEGRALLAKITSSPARTAPEGALQSFESLVGRGTTALERSYLQARTLQTPRPAGIAPSRETAAQALERRAAQQVRSKATDKAADIVVDPAFDAIRGAGSSP